MDGPGFPLMDLPVVPLGKVFNFMTPLQLWNLANKNRRCQQFANLVKVEITDIAAYPTSIWVDYEPCQSDYHQFESPTTSEEEWRTTVSSVCKFLGQSCSTLIVETEDIETTWSWIHSDQRDVKTMQLTIKNSEDPRKALKTILKNRELKKCDSLCLDLEVPESFKFSDPLIFDKTMECLVLERSSWLTVQNIVECNVKVLQDKNSTLRDEDLNSLLKNWMKKFQAESFEPTKRRVTIEKSDRQEFDLDVLLDGLRLDIRSHFICPHLGDTYYFWWDNNYSVIVSLKEHTLLIDSCSPDHFS